MIYLTVSIALQFNHRVLLVYEVHRFQDGRRFWICSVWRTWRSSESSRCCSAFRSWGAGCEELYCYVGTCDRYAVIFVGVFSFPFIFAFPFSALFIYFGILLCLRPFSKCLLLVEVFKKEPYVHFFGYRFGYTLLSLSKFGSILVEI